MGRKSNLKRPKPLARLEHSLTFSNLWMPILSLSSKRNVYAYVLPLLIEKEFSFKPSRLMIYLVLYKLENEGLLSSFEKGKRKYYKITPSGRKCLAKGRKVLAKWSKKI